MRLTLLGTGTPAPSLRRMSSGYLLEVGNDVIVMDHGPGAHHRLLETRRKAADVTHCFISHLHYDHFMDFPRLLMTRWDQGAGRLPELQVFGPAPLRRIVEQLIGDEGVYGLDLRARTTNQASLDIYTARGGVLPRRRPAPVVRELSPGDDVVGNGWRLTVGAGWHAQPILECLAYRIEADGAAVCYSGDSGGVCPGIIDLARGADLLVHMNHYFSGTEPSQEYRRFCGNHMDTAAVAREAGVKTVVLTHLTEQIDRPRVRERVVREMAAVFDGDIILGEDLMRIDLSAGRVGRID